MGATWSNFTLVQSTTGSAAGALAVSSLQANDIVISAVACYGYSGELPSMAESGIAATSLFEKNNIPYDGYYQNSRWYYNYYRYYNYYYYYWNRWNWWYYSPTVVAKVAVWRADDAGQVSISFSEPSGYGHIFSTALSVWRPVISVGVGEAVSDVGFAQNAKAPANVGNVASLPIQADDLLIAMGADISGDAATADISLAGPASQALFDFFPVYASRSVRIKIWRATSAAEANLTYSHCQTARMATSLRPNVKVVQTAYPTVTDPYAYVEIQPELTSRGRVVRPEWFNAIRTAQSWAINFGLRKRWVQEAMGSQDSEILSARIIEMWKVDKTLVASIPVSEAYVYATEQLAEDRVTALDQGW